MSDHLPELERLGRLYVEEARRRFGDDLVAAALYGSVARGRVTTDSDIDILLIVRDLPFTTGERVTLAGPIEEALRPELRGLHERGIWTSVSALLHTPEDAESHPPAYLDMTEDAHLLYDPHGFLAGVLEDIRQRLRELGGHRVWLDEDRWYWVLKKDYVLGERIEV